MPIAISKTTGGTGYMSPFLNDLAGNVIHVQVDVSALTTSQVDSDGVLKPGVVLSKSGGVAGVGSGTAQVETATVAGAITGSGAGNVKATITSKYYDTPIVVTAAVANSDTAATAAGNLRTALSADTRVTNYYTVGGSSATITLTAKTVDANDTTLNIATDNDTSAGLTATPTSANTTPGVSVDEAVVVVAPVKIADGNTALSGVTNDPFVACCPGFATLNRDIAEDNLGRAYLPSELAALKAAGFKLT